MLGFILMPIIVYIEKIVFLEKKCKYKKGNKSNKMLDRGQIDLDMQTTGSPALL
jgi:hypothetical protein